MKVRKRVLPRTIVEHINIRLKLARGNLVILVGLGLKVGWNQSSLCDITQITLRSELLSQIRGSDAVRSDRIHRDSRITQ